MSPWREAPRSRNTVLSKWTVLADVNLILDVAPFDEHTSIRFSVQGNEAQGVQVFAR